MSDSKMARATIVSSIITGVVTLIVGFFGGRVSITDGDLLKSYNKKISEYQDLYKKYIELNNELIQKENYINELKLSEKGKVEDINKDKNTEASNTDRNHEIKYTYIEDLPRIEMDMYTGNQGDSFIDKLGSRNGKIDLENNAYTHGLEVWVARWNDAAEKSWVNATYKLDKAYNNLTGKVVVIGDSFNTTNFNSTLQIFGDDNLLEEYNVVPRNIPIDISTNIEGYTFIELRMFDNEENTGGTSFGIVDFLATE